MDRSRVDVGRVGPAVGKQVTLVAHYGEKPSGLVTLVQRLQQLLDESIGQAFHPYELGQVHCTIAGLEACRVDGRLKHGRSGSTLDLDGLVGFLRGPAFVPLQVRIGGYAAGARLPFRSRGAHPHLRSFSMQGNAAVAMGWPSLGDEFPDSLDRFRRSLEAFGVRHKWHATVEDVDNDCFFVLGLVDRGKIGAGAIDAATARVRADLGSSRETTIEIDRGALSFVGYTDPALPCATTERYALDEPDLTRKLAALYPDCDRPTDKA